MVKKRVHEVAKELDLESKELVRQLARMGIEAKSHMSTLDDGDIEKLRKHFSAPKGKPAAGNKTGPTAQKTRENSEAGKQEARSGRDNYRSQHNRYDRGPGLVDRVPSRPPDRRFTDKPARFPSGGKGAPAGKKTGGGQTKPARQQQQTTPPQRARAENPAHQPEKRPAPVNRPQPNTRPEPARERRDHRPGQTQHGRQAGTGAPEARPQRPQKPFEQGRKDGRASAPPSRAGAPGGHRPGGAPGPRGGDKAKFAEKAKPDRVKALEKTKAQERVKQVEKHAYKGKADKKGRYGKDNRDQAGEKSAAFRRDRRSKRKPQPEQRQAPARERKPITIGETVTVKNLAEKMAISASDIIKKLMSLGVLANINQEIDSDTATILANEVGFKVQVKLEMEKEAMVVQEVEDKPAELRSRPCVVTIMGHVDHGKTSLLDAVRQSNVTASEAGGITQHIGAYQVEHKGKKITFVDTPGHEAFTAMRARGARVTDIAILVVAADDGVMPQTVEAINHARAAEVPIIIAVNKIDKLDADAQRVKRELTEYNLVAEEWGGETIFVEVSAKEKTNINELLEMILLVSEINEFKANPNRPARGTVVEAELDKGRGPVATVLVQNGTLRVGDFIIAGVAYGKVRAMMDHTGRRVKKAGPSTPVEVLGFSEVPPAGELFFAVEDEKLGKQVIDERSAKKREVEMKAAAPKVSLEDLFNQIKEGQVKELNIIIKADVQGSVEALRQALEQINTDEVRVNVIHGGVGAVTETDIMLASASNAIVIGFSVRPDVNARRAVETEKVDIRLYRVIYDAIEDIKAAMSGLLEPDYKEVVQGRAEVRKTFKVSRVGTIAGCYVTEGKVNRDAGVRVIRDGIVVHEGSLDSLKRFKDDVREVQQGYECGMTVEKFNDIREGDQVEAYTVEEVKRELA
ncbi:MAG: translation initiation factor IF-2 [Firmicutes bacterium]|nr:translation initiation factor IF-2 [Bacillota bacterium]